MKAAVIIPVTRPKCLNECLDRLFKQTSPHLEFEIILIRNPGSVCTLGETDIKITQIEEEILHPAFRRNLAVKKVDAEILAFLDDDAVPPLNWLQKAIWNIENENIDGVCGPILQSQNSSSMGNILAGAANESIFLEGFEDCNIYKKKLVEFYNIPLCNVIIKRKVWESVGGFNEKANYYIDDFEFFYIASKKGFKFYNIPDIAIRHSVEPFPLKYLKKKFKTRFYTGMNSIMFNEIYRSIPFIRLAFFIFPLFAVTVFLLLSKGWLYIIVPLIIYIGLAIWHSRLIFAKSKKAFILLPTVFFFTHLVNFIAFTLGAIFFIVKRRNYSVVVKHKKERLTNAGIV
jgi:GT2 family glycosyltransferase